jgi:chemotaxis protein MotB
LESIEFEKRALAFTSGGIQKSTPREGVVNVITGDNQTTGDRMIVGMRSTIYLRFKNPGEVAVGDLYTIYKRVRKVFHPVTREYLGYLIHRLAVVEVVQADHELTTAYTVKSFGAVEPGDPVMKFAVTTPPETTIEQPANGISGMVVDFQADRVMTLVAQNNVIYIDRGWEDGVQSGDLMDVVRVGGNLPPRVVGEMTVLATEARTSSAVISKSTSRILVGDRVRTTTPTSHVVPISQHGSPNESELTRTSKPEAVTPPKFKVQNVAGETRINLNDLAHQLRFESGDASIKAEGYQVLDQVVEYLNATAADKLIRIEGHADNMEIGPSLKSRYPTNWDLSKARAGGVTRYLIEKGGIDSARLSSIGFGDTRPMASNATEAGRQQNRRVDVVLYSPEATQRPAESMERPIESADSSFSSGGARVDAPPSVSEKKEVPAKSDVAGNEASSSTVSPTASAPADVTAGNHNAEVPGTPPTPGQ